MKLSEIAHGRDNNFNLIRFFAAFAVLLSHSLPLATGQGRTDPLWASHGLTFGDLAVDLFFITSGFLVTGSLLTRRGAVAFIWARALRIFPALWVMLGITVFVMGLSLTTEPAGEYLHDGLTWHYLLTNATLFNGIAYRLPGLFASNPFWAVNGSLWTLAPEVVAYAGLVALWLAAALARRFRLQAFHIAIIALTIFSGAVYLCGGRFEEPFDPYTRLTFMFSTGASLYVTGNLIELRKWLCVLLLAASCISLFGRTAFFFTLTLGLPYVLMCAAYLFAGPVRVFNRLGDYSYGIYIYAYPVQQAVVSLFHGISVAALMACSSIITLALAILSWHLIEKRALALKAVCTDRTQAWFGRVSASLR